MFDLSAVASGFAVGLIVGMTGVGGGSLMTPLLLGMFKLEPAVAIGTDLWFAALTKTGGAITHARFGHVDWRTTRWLLAGSLPGTVATVAVMHATGVGDAWRQTLTFALGVALLLTALAIAIKPVVLKLGQSLERHLNEPRRRAATVAAGALLGVLVTLSSIGAGALGASLLLLLNPRWATHRVVGTDIAHAVPLTLVAGIGHATLGHVEWLLLPLLLAGSLPGIHLGALLSRKLPDRIVRALLCGSLLTAGIKVVA
jgi:uncharacterized protein